MAIHGRLYGCPVELALDMIGGQSIENRDRLARLKQGRSRYGALRRELPDLAPTRC